MMPISLFLQFSFDVFPNEWWMHLDSFCELRLQELDLQSSLRHIKGSPGCGIF